MDIVVRVFPVTSTPSMAVLELLEGFLFSDVINSGLETVIIPRCFRFGSSSLCRVYVDYFFFWFVGWW